MRRERRGWEETGEAPPVERAEGGLANLVTAWSVPCLEGEEIGGRLFRAGGSPTAVPPPMASGRKANRRAGLASRPDVPKFHRSAAHGELVASPPKINLCFAQPKNH